MANDQVRPKTCEYSLGTKCVFWKVFSRRDTVCNLISVVVTKLSYPLGLKITPTHPFLVRERGVDEVEVLMPFSGKQIERSKKLMPDF
jgi:hypothetical protein